jgi:rfaE bifunctional protein kinase chain/domain
VRLVVCGDIMLDRFLWGSASRISPEAPVPVVRIERDSAGLGGAGNVCRNSVALGAAAMPIGVHGDDAEGEILLSLCRSGGIPTDGLVRAAGRPTTVKTRVVAQHQHVVRFDREEDGPLDAAVSRALEQRVLESLPGAGALVISDYDKGVLSAGLLAAILPAAASRGIPVVVDPKVRLFSHYAPATVVTPNMHEASEAAGMRLRTDEEVEAAGQKLLGSLGCPHLLITRGERGMVLHSAGSGSIAIPAVAREVFDVSGAGDTVVATLALALASGATMQEAALLANQAAGVVVGRLGTAVLTRAELLDAHGTPPRRGSHGGLRANSSAGD